MTIEKKEFTLMDGAYENGIIRLKHVMRIVENGVVLSEKFDRGTLNPGDDLTEQDPIVVAAATAIWTPEKVSAWTSDFVAQQEAERKQRQDAIDAIARAEQELEAAHQSSLAATEARRAEAEAASAKFAEIEEKAKQSAAMSRALADVAEAEAARLKVALADQQTATAAINIEIEVQKRLRESTTVCKPESGDSGSAE